MRLDSPIGAKALVIAICASMVICGLVLVTPSANAQNEEKTLKIALAQDIPDFNTWNLASNSIWKQDVLGFGFEGLVGLDYDLKPYPLLAQSWTFDPGTLSYIFHLRPNVLFSDGMSSMNADDVVFMYKAVREGTTFSYNIVNAFDANGDGVCDVEEINSGVEKVDDMTVRMVLAKPYGQFLTTTAGLTIMPMRIWQDHLTDSGILDVLWNDPAAAVSTGPFRYAGGVADSYRVMEKWTGYWGRDFTTPLGFRLYAAQVDTLYFKIYLGGSSEAVQALEVNAVDYIASAIPAATVPELRSDPDVSLSYLPENGYFYLAFNEKYEPMNNLSFRRAVSHLIDKDTIVNDYLGGYGVAGSACEPPFWGTGWFNTSVSTYPLDLAAAGALLDMAGYLDTNGDGFRELPDGSVMQQITILTPPWEYDTVRANAGELIAKNMRQVGINAVSMDINFDTLVAKLQSMDFQMLIIGWSLTSDPVGNVFDILGPFAPSNTFGFWSLDQPNPFYSSLGGVSTRADAATQELADQVNELGSLARSSFSIDDQQRYTKWAEGVIADAVPVNILYYRINVEGHGSGWTGWLPFMGTLLNIYSIANLRESGGPGVEQATMAVNAGLSLPGKVPLGQGVTARIEAIDQKGAPVSGAIVSISIAGYAGAATASASPSSGLTDANGGFEFTVTGTALGHSIVNVTVSNGAYIDWAEALIEVVKDKPTALLLDVAVGSQVLGPGEVTDLGFTVVDEYGSPVAGASISVDSNLVSYGSVSPGVVLTNANGQASMSYAAPGELLPNGHLEVPLAFIVQKEGYAWSQSVVAPILLYNTEPSSWSLVNVVSVVGSPALTKTSDSMVLVLQSLDPSGMPLPNDILSVSYTNDSALVSPVRTVVTDGSGMASVPFQIQAGAPSTAFHVSVQNVSRLDSVAASVTVTYYDPAMPPSNPMYAGYITYFDGATNAPFIPALGMTTATAHIWNFTGEPANNVPAGIVVSSTSFGTIATSDLIMVDANWDGWGINIVTTEDKMNIVTGGPMNSPFDYANWQEWYYMGYIYSWDWGMMYGNNITDGQLEMTIYGVDVAPVDLISSIYVIPDSMGFFNGASLSYEIDGTTLIGSELVVQRTFDIVATRYSIDTPMLAAKASEYESTSVRAWVTDEAGAPVLGADVIVFQKFFYYARATDYRVFPSMAFNEWRPDYTSTNSEGYAIETVEAIGTRYAVTPMTISADIYVRGTIFGSYPIFSKTNLIIYTQQMFVTLDPITSVVEVGGGGGGIPVAARVTDVLGNPIQGVSVELAPSAGTVAPSSALTDSMGVANFSLNASSVTVAIAGFMTLDARASAAGYSPATAMMMVAVHNASVTDTHHVVKGAQGPRASAVSWEYVPAENGRWQGHIVNSGLRSLVVDVYDVTSGTPSSIWHQKIRFAAHSTNELNTAAVLMAKDRIYLITVVPNGPEGTSCTVEDMFQPLMSPVAMFTSAVTGTTVTVDGSGSYDPAGGTITGWSWDWGDGTTSTGVTASHRYTAAGTCEIVLTVISSGGLTSSASATVRAG